MSVSNYKPSNCKYTYDKLKRVIYLVSEDHVKNVYIDNGEAYCENITELPLRLNGFDIRFSEETSLDERYLFQKTVTLSMHGYVDKSVFDGRYYVILESMDGTFWMVNVDFPSRVTYTFNLSNNTYQTDFTLTSYSNFPTLRLDENFEAVSPPCLGFNTFGVESLRLIERGHTDLNTTDMTVKTYGTTFKDIEFMGESCSFQSQFDGFKCTDTLSFNIPFDAYKSSWQYNLLEFTQNRYSAIIKPKSSENTIFAGFNFGLHPNYAIQTSDNIGESDVITVTMTEMSDNGMTAALRWSDQQTTETRWVWVRKVGEIICWECVGYGKARYLVQREVLANGLSTGRYKVLEGYEDEYSMLNVVGTFDETELFDNNTCGGGSCNINTDIPLNISFDGTGCTSYSFSSDCDWQVGNLNANWLTVSPMSGTGGQDYTIQVCNSTTDVDYTWFTINTGGGTRTVNVSVNDASAFLRPPYTNIDCLAQTVNFAYTPSCPITIIGHDDRTTYQLTNGRLTVQVPRNSTTSTTTYNYTARDCNGVTQTIHIYQDQTYERWVNTGGYICQSGNSYQEQARYTGTTSTSTNTLTNERRAGDLIESGDTRCSDYTTKWEYTSAYTICIDGNEWAVEEEYISYDAGVNWSKTDVIRPMYMIGTDAEICEETPEVEWRLTDRWLCLDEEEVQVKVVLRTGTGSETVECNTSNTLTQAEITGATPMSSITSAEIGNCVKTIGTNAFYNAGSITSVALSDSVNEIQGYAFYNCSGMTSFTVSNNLVTIGSNAFNGCRALRSFIIPDRVTSIGSYAFANCYALSSIEIGTRVSSLPSSVFRNCSGLTSVILPPSVTSIGSDTFRSCLAMRTVTLSRYLTWIGTRAFMWCSRISQIEIPERVDFIGNYAFQGCTSLTITMVSTTPPTLEPPASSSEAYYQFDGVVKIRVPMASLTAYETAAGWSEFANKLVGY